MNTNRQIIPRRARTTPVLRTAITSFTTRSTNLRFNRQHRPHSILSFSMLLNNLVSRHTRTFSFNLRFNRTRIGCLVISRHITRNFTFLTMFSNTISTMLRTFSRIHHTRRTFFLRLRRLRRRPHTFITSTITLQRTRIIRGRLHNFQATRTRLIRVTTRTSTQDIRQRRSRQFISIQFILKNIHRRTSRVNT